MKSLRKGKGIKPVSELIQADSMSDELRNSLWNALDVALWSTENYLYKQYGEPFIDPFSRSLWFNYFKQPIDSRPDRSIKILEHIRKYFFECPWNEVYDFLEFVVSHYARSKPRLAEYLNGILERELSAYRFVSGHLTDITNTQELEMLDVALKD